MINVFNIRTGLRSVAIKRVSRFIVGRLRASCPRLSFQCEADVQGRRVGRTLEGISTRLKRALFIRGSDVVPSNNVVRMGSSGNR